MAKKDHTVVADRITSDALGLFQNVHDKLHQANDLLEEGIAADKAEMDRLDARLRHAVGALNSNDTVAKKIKEFLGA